MPFKIVCGNCGTVLGKFDKFPCNPGKVDYHGSPADRVIQDLHGKCPRCGKTLETDVNKQHVSVSAFNPYVEPLLETSQ